MAKWEKIVEELRIKAIAILKDEFLCDDDTIQAILYSPEKKKCYERYLDEIDEEKRKREKEKEAQMQKPKKFIRKVEEEKKEEKKKLKFLEKLKKFFKPRVRVRICTPQLDFKRTEVINELLDSVAPIVIALMGYDQYIERSYRDDEVESFLDDIYNNPKNYSIFLAKLQIGNKKYRLIDYLVERYKLKRCILIPPIDLAF